MSERLWTSSSVGVDLDLAGRQVRVDRAGRARLDLAGDADDRLGLAAARPPCSRIGLRVELHLGDALAVAQVDEDDAAVVADGIHPAEQRDGRAEVGLGELGAVMGAVHGKRQPARKAVRP